MTMIQFQGQTAAKPAVKTNPFTQPAVRFSGDDNDTVEISQKKADDEAPKKVFVSTLNLSDAESVFLNRVQTTLAPYSDPAYVQKLDETKRPPLEVLETLTKERMNILGLPIPDKSLAVNLISNPEFKKAIMDHMPVDKATALMASAKVFKNQGAPKPKQPEIGYARQQAISAIEMADVIGAGVSTFLGVNGGLAAEAIGKIATPEQSAFWLNAINEGKITSAFGLTEENIGSDPRSMETTFKKVTKDGKTSYILNGNKKYIGNAAQVKDPNGKVIHPGADFIIVFAVDDPNKAPEERSFRAFMVPRSAIGEENIRPSGVDHNKLGLREVNNGDFDLINVEIPEALMIGKEGEDIYPTLLGALDETRLFVGAMGLGMAKAAVRIGEDYAKKRNQYGRTIEGFQAISFPLREMKAKTLAAELLVMHAANKIDHEAALPKEEQHSTRFRTDTSMAKLFATEVAEDATRRALKTMGGRGFMEDPKQNQGIAKRLRDVTVLPIYEGTSEIQKNVIAQGALIRAAKHSPKNQLLAYSSLKKQKITSQVALSNMVSKFKGHPLDVVNTVSQFAFSDFSLRYAKEIRSLSKEWQSGKPADYANWDKKSQKREKAMLATLPIQKRMHILADISTYQQATYLAHRELRFLETQESLSDAQQETKELLTLFMQIAKEQCLSYYQELRGDKLEMLEADFNRK